MDLQDINESLDNREQWRILLKEARYLGITPEEIRGFLKMDKNIDLSKWRHNVQDRK